MKRATFLTTSASLVATAAPVAAGAAAIPGGSHLVERKADFDEAGFARLVGRPAQIRQLWEAVSFHPQMFNNIKNALNGLQFGFGYAPSAIAMAVAVHGPSSAYNYSDAIWSKYRIGEAFKLNDADGKPYTSNVFLAPKNAPTSTNPDDDGSVYQDTSIQSLQKRGVVFLTCHTAVEEQARTLVKNGYAPASMTAQDVANDMLTNLIPGAAVVPSMVATVAVLQAKYHYTYATLTF